MLCCCIATITFVCTLQFNSPHTLSLHTTTNASTGAQHTCCSDGYENCSPGTSCADLEGTECNPTFKYIMYPFLASGPNSLFFDPCSIKTVTNVVKHKGTCFTTGNVCAQGGTCCQGTLLAPNVSKNPRWCIFDLSSPSFLFSFKNP